VNLLYISYWGLKEGLTQSTVLPHLELLAKSETIEKIVFVTIERKDSASDLTGHTFNKKVKFQPFFSKVGKILLLTKMDDFIRIPLMLQRVCVREQISYIIARSTPAGNLAYLVHKKSRIPFLVESFEPHADYMLESMVWKRSSLRYRLQRYWEEKQKQFASGLITVSYNYKNHLLGEGLMQDKVQVAPCAVDFQKFAFNRKDRERVREKLNIPQQATVGIYLGKFGDIYFGEEAFKLFKDTYDFFEGFYLIILSPNDFKWIWSEAKRYGIDPSRLIILTVPHHEVPGYLSASDFAYSLIKSSPVKAFCSPIKNGEYWANGLPVILPDGIGDDAKIIKDNNAGVIYDIAKENFQDCLINIKLLLAAKVVQAYRHFKIVE
jgi:glycosyltransferase involved in cell wall biosynthesis